MSSAKTSMPHLACLKTVIDSLGPDASTDPSVATRLGAASHLLDNMIVAVRDVPAYKADCYAAMLALLPAIEKAAGDTGVAGELTSLCRTADQDDFDRFLQLTSEVQRRLFALNTRETLVLCKQVFRIESGYNSRIAAAVAAQAATSVAAAGKMVSTARNDRAYDEAALLGFIRRAFPDERDVEITQTSLVSGGFSKFTLSINLAKTRSLPQHIVLRGDGSGAFGGASVVDEYRLIKAAYEHGVRVPRPLAVEETGVVFGTPFLLVEKRPSTVIGHQFGAPKPNKAISDDIATQLAAIHRVPLKALGDKVNGANSRTSEKILAWIDEGFAMWKPLNMPSPVFETAFDWLRRNVGINDRAPRTLVHGDFVLNNILTHDDKVSAILDWEFSHIGNPAYDLGYSYHMASSLASWEEYLDAYGRAGVPIPDDDQLDYHILLAATRLGAMVSQVACGFASGADTGIAGAVVIGDNYYEQMIGRISSALERVL